MTLREKLADLISGGVLTRAELLGAINYLAACVLMIEEAEI